MKYKLIGAGVILFVAAIVWLLNQYAPPIVVSPQTTVVTSPLADDGLPDYEAYLLARGAEGVTPRNNAAVLLWRTCWWASLPVEDHTRMAKALGMAVPARTDGLTPLHGTENCDALGQRLAGGKPLGLLDEFDRQDIRALAAELIHHAETRPWTADQLPTLAAWVEANRKALDLAVEASQRPRYWSPSPTYLNGRYDQLLDRALPLVHAVREADSGLAVRAMHAVGEGRLEDAWADTLAGHRLAAMLQRQDDSLPALVGINVAHSVYLRTQAVLSHPQLPKLLAEQILADLRTLLPARPVDELFDNFERLQGIEAVVAIGGGRDPDVGETEGLPIDWNVGLRLGNELVDQYVEILRETDRGKRDARFRQYHKAAGDLLDQSTGLWGKVAWVVSKQSRSKSVARMMMGLVAPAGRQMVSAFERYGAERDLLVTAAALAVHRAETGEYPAMLDELVPDARSAPSADLYTGKPFVYRRTNDGGYLLYSVYEDASDDGGTDFAEDIVDGEWADPDDERQKDEGAQVVILSEPTQSKDLVIRVPLPPFRIP